MKACLMILILLTSFLASAADVSLDYVQEVRSGGDTTVVFNGQTIHAFQQPAANLTEDEVRRHVTGDSLFERNFTDDLSRPDHGLGPVFNNSNCAACHAKDGRGALPVLPFGQNWVALRQNESVFLRISIENGQPVPRDAAHNWGGPQAVPGYSTQLFHLGSFGLRDDAPGVGQAMVWMSYQYSQFTYPDGQVVSLRKPVFKITDAYSNRIYQSDVHTSPRMGTPMIGLGLLEAIPEKDILALAARDLSAEGVHGKPNYVYDVEKDRAGNPFPVSLGRFGLKANTPSVFHQALGALNGDIGVTNFAFPVESIFGTPLFDAFKAKLEPLHVEASDEVAKDLVFYSQTLAVPSRRNVNDPEVQRGALLFHQVSCTSCHQPSFTTGAHPTIAAFSHQKIYPFTDMLLHDMGPGLADDRQDFDANGRQWKTRPLWGLGHTQTINPRAGFLHDGRARTPEEAILWHDGEAAYSRDEFAHLPAADRAALIQFVRSL